MSVSHPYLKQLKVHVLRFHQHHGAIQDDHPSLLPFCRTLEDIIRDGLRGSRNKVANEVQKTIWQWLSSLLKRYSTKQLTGGLQLCIEYAKESKKAIYGVGKGRLAIRSMLNKGLLSHCIRLARQHQIFLNVDEFQEFYEEISILGDDILSEMLLSLLAPLEMQVKFALNLRNCSFLDETWDLPWFRRYEMVPCKRMGVELQVVEGRIVVMEVEPGSVADEDMKIEPGDIIDDLFGESLRQSNIRKVVGLMEDFQGSPIYVSVIKCIHQDGQFYRAMFAYLEGANLCKQAIQSNRERRLREMRETGCDWDCTDALSVKDGKGQDRTPTNNERRKENAEKVSNNEITESGLYKCQLWGFVHVGTVGTVEQIESGVMSVVKRNPELKREVLVELGETEVTVFCAKNKTVLLQHGYPEISSCGRRIDFPLNFSYIAGETTCTLAKKFTCFVFEAMSDEQAKAVLKGIATGFDRTHWAV